MIAKEVLQKEYLVKMKPMHQIATEQNISVGTVFNYMKLYDIKSRKRMSELTKKKISKVKKGKVSPNKGKKLSKETRQKISRAKLDQSTVCLKNGGHKKKRSDGYIAVWNPRRKSSNSEGYIMEHRLIMENHLKKFLKENEVVHHKNGIRDDNRIENLQVMTFKEHARLHMLERYRNKIKEGVMTYQ